MGFRQKIIISVSLLLIAVVCILVFVNYNKTKGIIVETSEASSLMMAKQVDSKIEGWLNQKATLVDSLEYFIQTDNKNENIASIKMINQKAKFLATYYGLENGEMAFNDDWVPDSGYVVYERDWYIAAKKAGKPVVTELYIDDVTKNL